MSFYSINLTTQENSKSSASLVQSQRKVASSKYRYLGKRTLDLAVVALTAWFALPIIGVLALAVLVTGQSPFYVQERVGLHGRTFRMWKLRTMLPNAETRLEAYLVANPHMRSEWDSKQKLMNDPRITPIGNWLRKTSMDELPQLFNVFNGTMSLVGPRPMMLSQKEQYSGTAYYRLRPGMTGLWQVSDRNGGEFIGRVQFDEIYDGILSFGTDMRVLTQTVMVIIRGTGC